MIPPELFLLLHHQRHEALMQQAEQMRLMQANRRRRGFDAHVFLPFLWWVGGALFSWGCALQQAGGARASVEKGCWVCL